jgi:DNA processing protein
LVKKITENGGAILTEFEPGTKPDAGNFPVRNRIVSGMSLGVLVIETGVKGGSMITARSALDQNREVFVVPHPLDSEKGEGCNYLIKTGQGKLVQSMQDILVEIPHEADQVAEKPRKLNWEQAELDEESLKLCKLLSEGTQHIDFIGEKTGKPTYQILPVLLDLEMKGLIRQKAGKYFELM